MLNCSYGPDLYLFNDVIGAVNVEGNEQHALGGKSCSIASIRTESDQVSGSGAPFVNNWMIQLGFCLVFFCFGYGYLSHTSSARIYSRRIFVSAIILSILLLAVMVFAMSPYQEFLLQLPASSLDWYILCLEESPVMTKSITTAIIQIAGDYCAQFVEEYRIRSSNGRSSSSWQSVIASNYDARRGLSMAADGFFLSGPLLHYAFEFMEHVVPTDTSSDGHASLAALLHVLLNDYVVDSVYLALSFVFVTAAEGHTGDMVQIFQKDFFNTLKASWGTSIALIPVEFLSFLYLPLSFRVLAMNFLDIIWGAIISFVAHRSRRKNGSNNKNE